MLKKNQFISARQLKEHSPCEDLFTMFKRKFPKGAKLTKKNLEKLAEGISHDSLNSCLRYLSCWYTNDPDRTQYWNWEQGANKQQTINNFWEVLE